jgi:hypothetical protein
MAIPPLATLVEIMNGQNGIRAAPAAMAPASASTGTARVTISMTGPISVKRRLARINSDSPTTGMARKRPALAPSP